MPDRVMTPRQLRAVVHQIAHVYLEVERGLRPPDHLRRFLTVDEYARHRTTQLAYTGPAGPVRSDEIGRIHLSQFQADRVHGSVQVRRGENETSALIVDLQHSDSGWKVDTLGRLEHVLTLHDLSGPDDDLVTRRLRTLNAEIEAISGAVTALDRRGKVTDGRTAHGRALRARQLAWSTRIEQLRVERMRLERGFTGSARPVQHLLEDAKPTTIRRDVDVHPSGLGPKTLESGVVSARRGERQPSVPLTNPLCI